MFKRTNQRGYGIKRTISIKMFSKEFGNGFHENVKNRLLDLDLRTVLTRGEDTHILDIKHVEHIKKDNKEHVYGQFIVDEGILYFSEKCKEHKEVRESEIIKNIYANLNTNCAIINDINAKQIDETNIDFVVDSILNACPDVSARYMEVMGKYLQ